MAKNIPDSAAISILREERLSDEMLGVELQVQVKDFGGQPVPGWPFSINTGNQVLAKGTTNESGEYRGQRVLQLREGNRIRIFLTLEGSAVTALQEIPKGGAVRRETSDPYEGETYPEHYEVDVHQNGTNYGILYSMWPVAMGMLENQAHIRLFLMAYNPSVFQRSFMYLMDSELFDTEIGKPPGHAVYQFRAFAETYHMPPKIELDLLIKRWSDVLKSQVLESETLKTKLRCVLLDLKRIQNTLTQERIEKLIKLNGTTPR